MGNTVPIVLWEQPPVACYFITRAAEPRYEVRLHIKGILLDSRCSSTSDEATAYAIAQAGVYRPL